MCAQKLICQLNLQHGTTTKKSGRENLKSKKMDSISKQSGKSMYQASEKLQKFPAYIITVKVINSQ